MNLKSGKGQFVEDNLINLLIYLVLLVVVIGLIVIFKDRSISVWNGLLNWMR